MHKKSLSVSANVRFNSMHKLKVSLCWSNRTKTYHENKCCDLCVYHEFGTYRIEN